MQHWQPSASIKNLRARANILNKIRRFFAERDVLEVETPLLCQFGVTDAHIENIPATFGTNEHAKILFLQTSPEYAMKRLLAAGSGSIFQLCKAFRNDEQGRLHNPEFTMLEWYRLGFTHHDLMDEMDLLLQTILQSAPAVRTTYKDLFLQFFAFNPHQISQKELIPLLKQHGINLSEMAQDIDRDTALDLLMSHCIEPKIGFEAPLFVYDYPASQAALAKIRHDDEPVGERFEVYIQGVELANGFHELSDANEQLKRFQQDQHYRQTHHLPEREIDPYFMAALQHGLPACAGVALGIDRLLMLALKEKQIDKVLFCA